MAEPLTSSPDLPEDAPMSDGAEVGGACEVGRDGSPPDASMPDGSWGGGGSAAAAPLAGGTPHAERASGQKRKESCYGQFSNSECFEFLIQEVGFLSAPFNCLAQ